MSVFRVALQNVAQGLLDLNPATATPVLVGDDATPYLGAQMNPSIQRTIHVAGPHNITRDLFDGQTFTDCNYWKRFAYPQVPLDQAFIQVVTDDGSIYSDYLPENMFPLSFGGAVSYTVGTGDTFSTAPTLSGGVQNGGYIDILGTYGSYANFAQITNNGTAATQNIKVQLNGSANAIMSLPFGDTQVFNVGDLVISKLGFQGATGSGAAATTIQVILSVQSVCNS